MLLPRPGWPLRSLKLWGLRALVMEGFIWWEQKEKRSWGQFSSVSDSSFCAQRERERGDRFCTLVNGDCLVIGSYSFCRLLSLYLHSKVSSEFFPFFPVIFTPKRPELGSANRLTLPSRFLFPLKICQLFLAAELEVMGRRWSLVLRFPSSATWSCALRTYELIMEQEPEREARIVQGFELVHVHNEMVTWCGINIIYLLI